MTFIRLSSSLALLMSIAALSAQAAETIATKPAASAVMAASAVSKSVTGKVKVPVKATTATAGAAVSRVGDSTIPSGSIPIPPKPKKDALEATGAVKANVTAP